MGVLGSLWAAQGEQEPAERELEKGGHPGRDAICGFSPVQSWLTWEGSPGPCLSTSLLFCCSFGFEIELLRI